MLTVQACQQHQLAVMHPNKAKSFLAATVPTVAKLGYRRRGKRGTRSEERTNARRAHASKQKCRRWRSRGVVGVPHPTRRKNDGKNLGRKHLELSERRRTFARKKRRGKLAERKSASKKQKVARARSRLEELTFGRFNARTAAVNGVNGIIRLIDTRASETLCCKGLRRHLTAGDKKRRNFHNCSIWIPRLFQR